MAWSQRFWAEAALLLCLSFLQVSAKTGLCETETGQSNIILDIEESRGTQINQKTTPSELPIIGDPISEIILDLVFPKGTPIFTLHDKKLHLVSPLDRDKDNLSHIVFQLTCTVKSSNKKRTIPIIVRVSDINDNAPVFINTPYVTSVSEMAPVGTTVFQGLKAVDIDAGVNGLVEYTIIPGDGKELETNQGTGRQRISVADGAEYFAIHLPHQGQVTVNRTLDFERIQRYLVTVVASDRARNQLERFSATTTLTVNVQDYNDRDPSFVYQNCMFLDGACINPEYYGTVASGVLSGTLSITPEKIQAIDLDSINSPISYSFLDGTPESYREYFEINPNTGVVRQIKTVDTTIAKQFDIIVKAEEMSEQKRFATAKLHIAVKPVDSHPPQITASQTEGFVDENAPIGTKVIDSQKNPIRLTVTDEDLTAEDVKPTYTFELTTNFFNIDKDGYLVVAKENLDRDPPSPGKFRFQLKTNFFNIDKDGYLVGAKESFDRDPPSPDKLRFQIIAREKTGNAASPPLTLSVALNDINDNAPKLPVIKPLTVQAGEGRRQIVKVVATDNDLGENAEVSYSIYHVSNNGRNKFKIDAKSGAIETTGKLNAGEQYSITVQATDTGGKSSQTIVEVTVIPGPNTRSPVFQQTTYQVTVSEGAPINSTVTTITATDPENEPVLYSIISGNDLRQFAIDDKTGAITVIRRLDREDLTRYQLLIKAEDEGGLSSTATVNILVSDINDKNPEFVNVPYNFTVQEGLDGVSVGQVKALDADEGINAVVSYSLPHDVPFTINSTSGEIKTSMALDYEKQKEFKFVVTAHDGAPDPRIATASVTVHVTDIEDEWPIFHLTTYEANVPENIADYVVTQVMADDPDTKKKVTYVMRQGPTDLFAVDANTGVIRTLKGLDYETENQFTITIGTLENPSNRPGATTKVIINVQDQNDNAPVFLTVPKPITLSDDVAVGTRITTLVASDADGTAPGNKVRYEIVGRGKAARYFQIDPNLGEVRVKDDLQNEPDNEYQVDVKAYDLADPQQSTIITVTVYMRHTSTTPPGAGSGFTDESYTVEVPETSATNYLIKTFTIINNKLYPQTSLKCIIASGNEAGIFSVKMNENHNCELYLVGKLDHETNSEYLLKLQLESTSPLGPKSRTSTQVKIQVQDINDNVPQFIYPETSVRFKKDKYFAGISRNGEGIGDQILEVKTSDKDTGKLGQVVYRLIPDDTGAVDYFAIDPNLGIIRTRRALNTFREEMLPIKLTVEVRDNPKAEKDFNIARTQVVVNLIEDDDRLILVIDDKPIEEIHSHENTLVRILEQQSNMIIGIEKLTVKQYTKDNITLQSDPKGTDFWFYAVDPRTELIQNRSNPYIYRSLMSHNALVNISLDIATTLQSKASVVRTPIQVKPVSTTSVVVPQWEVFPYAFIAIAALITVLGVAAIIYICISWSRYKAYKERMNRMYVMPNYDPVFVEPSLKEYETQVLQMSVPLDDNDSFNDLQLDFSRKNHTFNLDNVGYITKDNSDSTGQQSPVSSGATTIRASTLGGRQNVNNNSLHHSPGIMNPVFDRSEDRGNLNSSSSNDNVTFKGKKDYSHLGFNYLADRSPIETTTEL